MRYIIRKEFYGAYCYDLETDTSLALDMDSYMLLDQFDKTGKVESDVAAFLEEEGFILGGEKNYRILVLPQYDTTLSSPGRIHFYYTDRCNLKCRHCFTKGGRRPHDTQLSFEDKLRLLDQMEALGIYEILIGGGEPFFEADFCAFVEECLKRKFVTKVFTNGLLLNQETIGRMSGWNLRYLSVSIDGKNDQEYYDLRGVRGLSVLKKNIRLLKERCSFPVVASITVSTTNCDSPAEYLALIKDLGVDRLKVRPTKPSGNVYVNPEIFSSAEQYSTFLKNLYKTWANEYRADFQLDCSWGDARMYYDEEKNTVEVFNYPFPYDGFGCFAGKGSMVMDSYGYVLPCGFLPESMQRTETDRFPEKSLKEIWDTGKRFTALRRIPANEVCPECEYYGVCRGGCLARILYAKLKINAVDPWCMKKYFPIRLNEK